MAFPDYLAKGDAITADHYREVTRAARAQLGGNGFGDADGGGPKPNRKSPQVIQIYSTVAIAKNSVFQIGLASQTADITIFNVQLVDGTTNKILCTNETNDIAANSYGYATVISFDRPVKVKASPANLPDVLEKCGVASGGTVVEAGMSGLICLSLADTNNMIEVVASPTSSGGKIWFKVVSISDYYWEVPGCEYIRAMVTQKSCSANVGIGDIVYIFDPFFCWFNLPIAIMMRITGTATFAENGFWDGVTPLVCGVTPGKCFWSVDSVCCLEEEYGTL